MPKAKKTPVDSRLGGEVSTGVDTAENIHSRLQRYADAKTRSSDMAGFLRSLPEHYTVGDREAIKAALPRIEQCGDWLKFRHYFTLDKFRLSGANFCMNQWICPLCAIRRGAKTLKAYTDKWEYLQMQDPSLRAYLVTLTVKNGEDLEERMDHLKRGVSRLLQRRRDYLSKGWGQTFTQHIVGGVGSYEVTNKGNGWHPHCHMIALAYVPLDHHHIQKQLSDEWHQITGDSFIVDIRPMLNHDEPAQDFIEVFKYAVKFSDLTLQQNVELWLSLRGSRMIFSFGAFYGVKVPDEWTDELLDGYPYVELLYNYLNGQYQASRRNTGEILIDDEVIKYGD